MQVYAGDITKVENIDAIVNAANAFGIMGAGVAGAIARSAGISKQHHGTNILEIVKEVVKNEGPFDVGDVYISDSGLLKRRGIKYIYHAVTMRYPGGLCSLSVIERLTKKVIERAIENDLKSIAICGLGCGIGGVDSEVAGKIMSNILIGYRPYIKIVVVDLNTKFIEAVKTQINFKLEQ